MALKRLTAPATTPISVAEAKAHLRVDTSDEDTIIGIYVDAAVSHLDGWSGILGRCLISQQWELYYDAFPTAALQLPLGNLISVDDVEYIDPDTELYVSWDDSNYDVDDVPVEGWIVPVDTWPTPMDTTNAVKVTFTAGYGSNASDVPAAIRHALLLLVGHWYENREAVNIGTAQPLEVPMTVDRLLGPFRRVGV